MVDVDAFKARIGNERFPYVSGIEARELVAMIERLQREAAAGRKLYAALKRHHENDLLESQFTESVERVLCAYEQRTGKAVGK